MHGSAVTIVVLHTVTYLVRLLVELIICSQHPWQGSTLKELFSALGYSLFTVASTVTPYLIIH